MKKQIVKLLFTYLSVVLISFTGSNELKAQVVFDIHPSGNIQLCAGASVILQADPLPPGYTYQWMMEDYGFNNCDFNIVAIPGATDSWITASSTSVYWCEAIDINGQSTTSMSPAWVASLSDSVKICYNSSLNFCKPDSVYLWTLNIWMGPLGGTPSLQWQLNGADIPGADFLSYYAKTSGTYRCRLTNSCGFKYTNSVVVTANPKPSAIITANGPTTFCAGGSVVLNAPAGANRAYQWKKGGNPVSGATASFYTATTGGNYKVIVTNTATGCSTTTGVATTVTVNPLPAATITPQGPTTFCAGGSVVLSANGGTGLSYQWKKGGNNISGATLQNYTASTAGTYKVVVTNANGCSKTSAGVVVTVNCRLSNESSGEAAMTIFPNPSDGMITLKFNSKENQNCKLIITDITGRELMHQYFITVEGINEKTFDISNLLSGVYLVKLKAPGKEITHRIVKE